jgi:hypothetical protein
LFCANLLLKGKKSVMTVIIIIFAILAVADVFLMWCLLRAGAMCEQRESRCEILSVEEDERGEGRQQK